MRPDRVPELVSGRIAARLGEALLVTQELPQPDSGAREAAVLILLCPAAPAAPALGECDAAVTAPIAPAAQTAPADEDLAVVLVRRSAALRTHAGQVAFPGGRREPGDADIEATALREAAEEAGIAASGVAVVARLPPLGLGPSSHHVTPVLAWWRSPAPLLPDRVEVVAAAAVPLASLADPAHRVAVRHPAATGSFWPGYDLPGGAGPGWFVWGFTAWLITALLTAAGADVDWDRSRVVDVPVGMR